VTFIGSTNPTLSSLIASNDTNKYVVIEALAGCGKTAMLTGLVKRINDKQACLLLSFTKQAVMIAKVRTDDGLHVQTFDSLFFQTVKHGLANGLDLDKTRPPTRTRHIGTYRRPCPKKT